MKESLNKNNDIYKTLSPIMILNYLWLRSTSHSYMHVNQEIKALGLDHIGLVSW